MGDVAKTLGFGGSSEGQPNLPGLLSQMLGGVGQTNSSLAPPSGDGDMVSRYLDRWNQNYPQSPTAPSNGLPTTPPNSPPTQAGAPEEKPINIDGWKPHHRTTLGTIADILLSGLTGAVITPFRDKSDSENMRDAMTGFTQDPENTIRRIAQFNPKLALALQEKYTDNSRQQGTLDSQKELFDMKKEELVYNRVASMMQGANKDTWGKMRDLAITIGNKYHVDPSTYIPTEYDPDSIEFIRNGAIKPLDQEKLKQGDARITETAEHHDALEKQAATNEGGRNNRAAINEAGRNNRHNNPVAKPPATSNPALKPIMTKYGPLVPSKSDPRRAVLTHGEKTYGYTNINGTWVPVGEVTLK